MVPSRLLCIDLQIDPANGLDPDPEAVFGARQLLSIGRRLGWTIAHARRRAASVSPASDATDVRSGAIRPLMTERVFFRSGRPVSESAGLLGLLESWRGETAFVAAFDHVALLSCLLSCYEHGPRLVLIEDMLSLRALTGKSSIDAFRTAAWHLAAGSTTIAGIIAETAHEAPALPAIPSPIGVSPPNMQV